MKFYINDIKSNLKDSPSSEEISDKLFQLGHENEIDKNLIDIEITPNRGDCLSLRGIARELSVFKKIFLDQDIFEGNLKKLNLNFKNFEKSACPRISFLLIELIEQTLFFL